MEAISSLLKTEDLWLVSSSSSFFSFLKLHFSLSYEHKLCLHESYMFDFIELFMQANSFGPSIGVSLWSSELSFLEVLGLQLVQ